MVITKFKNIMEFDFISLWDNKRIQQCLNAHLHTNKIDYKGVKIDVNSFGINGAYTEIYLIRCTDKKVVEIITKCISDHFINYP